MKKKKNKIPKIKLRKGDNVIVLSGDDKGKKGEIQEIFPLKGTAIVEDVNIMIKHNKPTQNNPGGRVEEPAAIRINKLALVDKKSGEATRIGRRVENGKLVRYSKKSGETID